MKRVLLILLACSLLLNGCSAADIVLAKWRELTGAASSTGREPAQTEGQRTVSGKIKELRGNEMTLELGTFQRSAGGAPDMENGTSGGQEFPGGQQPGVMPEGGGAPPEGGMPPEGGTAPQGERTEGQSTKNSRTGGAARSFSGTFEKTGGTEAYTIPVKTPVYAAGNSQTALNFTLLEVGQVITVTLGTDADGRDYIVSIQVVET